MKKIKNRESATAKPEQQECYLKTQIIGYIPNASVNATIDKKVNASITTVSVAADETVYGKVVAANTFIQIFTGSAEVIIFNKKHLLNLGDGLVIPPGTAYSVKANGQLKIISTIIESSSGDINANSFN